MRNRVNKDKIPTGSEIISMVLRNFLKLKKCRLGPQKLSEQWNLDIWIIAISVSVSVDVIVIVSPDSVQNMQDSKFIIYEFEFFVSKSISIC